MKTVIVDGIPSQEPDEPMIKDGIYSLAFETMTCRPGLALQVRLDSGEFELFRFDDAVIVWWEVQDSEEIVAKLLTAVHPELVAQLTARRMRS